ncbi:MAG: hypothetical protein V4592_17925 [Bacteroidota bacterium]
MKLFRKRDKNSGQPAVWLLGLRSVIEQRQRKVAGYLCRRTQYWNRGSWLLALGLFILLFGGCCLLLCIKAFIHF